MNEESLVVKTEHNWKLIFNSISDPVMILSLDNRILSANPAAVKASKLSEEKLQGKYCFKVFHNSDCPVYKCPFEKLKKSKQPEATEMEVKAFDKIYQVTISPILNKQGRMVNCIHIANDITEYKNTCNKLLKKIEELIKYYKIAGMDYKLKKTTEEIQKL